MKVYNLPNVQYAVPVWIDKHGNRIPLLPSKSEELRENGCISKTSAPPAALPLLPRPAPAMICHQQSLVDTKTIIEHPEKLSYLKKQKPKTFNGNNLDNNFLNELKERISIFKTL